MRAANVPDNKRSVRVHREPAAAEHPEAHKKISLLRRPGVIMGITAVSIVGIVYGATIAFHSMTHQSTDDAFVDVHVVSVAPKVAGRVSAVHVRDNELVKQGEVLVELDSRD